MSNLLDGADRFAGARGDRGAAGRFAAPAVTERRQTASLALAVTERRRADLAIARILSATFYAGLA